MKCPQSNATQRPGSRSRTSPKVSSSPQYSCSKPRNLTAISNSLLDTPPYGHFSEQSVKASRTRLGSSSGTARSSDRGPQSCLPWNPQSLSIEAAVRSSIRRVYTARKACTSRFPFPHERGQLIHHRRRLYAGLPPARVLEEKRITWRPNPLRTPPANLPRAQRPFRTFRHPLHHMLPWHRDPRSSHDGPPATFPRSTGASLHPNRHTPSQLVRSPLRP